MRPPRGKSVLLVLLSQLLGLITSAIWSLVAAPTNCRPRVGQYIDLAAKSLVYADNSVAAGRWLCAVARKCSFTCRRLTYQSS
jgi:hypothetical protein